MESKQAQAKQAGLLYNCIVARGGSLESRLICARAIAICGYSIVFNESRESGKGGDLYIKYLWKVGSRIDL